MSTAWRAVLLDAAGVLVLPDPGLVSGALRAHVGTVAPERLSRAHYRAVRTLDRDAAARDRPHAYFHALAAALGVEPPDRPEAARGLAALEDRRRSPAVLWSRPPDGALTVVKALNAAGIAVVVVTNSDGHAAENLRDAGVCQVGRGPGVPVTGIVDSALVGFAKPDPRIFRAALHHAGAEPEEAVHVGDTVHADVVGARAAGIEAIHLDPLRACRARDHHHVRSLSGLWRHTPALTRRKRPR